MTRTTAGDAAPSSAGSWRTSVDWSHTVSLPDSILSHRSHAPDSVQSCGGGWCQPPPSALVAQHLVGGVPPAHAVHPAARRRAARAQVDALQWGPPRMQAELGPHDELAQVSTAAVYVAAHVVGVVALDVGGAHRVAGDDPITEPRCEALDLGLDPVGHVDR